MSRGGWVPKKVLTRDEWRAFVAEARKLNPYWASLLLFLAYTGCRVSEAAELTWDRVNLEAAEVLIWRSKWGKSRRIPLHPEVARLLKKRRPDPPEGYVWPSKRRDGHVTIQAIYYRVRKVGEKIGVRGLHPHVLRHTFATLLLERGVSPPVVRDLLGHSSLAVTDVYSHARREAQRQAIAALR